MVTALDQEIGHGNTGLIPSSGMPALGRPTDRPVSGRLAESRMGTLSEPVRCTDLTADGAGHRELPKRPWSVVDWVDVDEDA